MMMSGKKKDEQMKRRMKRIRLEPCDDLEGGSMRWSRTILNSGKEKMNGLWIIIYSS